MSEAILLEPGLSFQNTQGCAQYKLSNAKNAKIY